MKAEAMPNLFHRDVEKGGKIVEKLFAYSTVHRPKIRRMEHKNSRGWQPGLKKNVEKNVDKGVATQVLPILAGRRYPDLLRGKHGSQFA